MFRRFITIAFISALFMGVGLCPHPARAQVKTQNLTAEQVAENAVFIYGTRAGLEQIRRNGIERGRTTHIIEEGRTEESSYERRFIRGASMDKDRVRLDQKTPTVEYSLLFGDGKMWGLINGGAFTPRAEASAEFLSQHWHGLDALLRYKENASKLNLVGKEKQKNVDMYVLELTDKENRRTRYYISARFFRVLWLEYEEPASGSPTPVKYQRRFYDYRYAQGTLVPFRSVLYVDSKQTSENRLLTVTYGVKMDEALFQNPDVPAATAAQP